MQCLDFGSFAEFKLDFPTLSEIEILPEQVAIAVKGLAKWYTPKVRPAERFWQALRRGRSMPSAIQTEAPTSCAFALHPVSFDVIEGEVVGIVGKNGAGKSTLLQLLCGTLQPSAGSVQIRGKIAALLELGAGFNPEFTGLENVRLNAAILGLSHSEIDEKLEGILQFADIGDYVYRPVKTYSSGMFVRLAFSVAVCVDPEILVVDEALSVGDGQFAKKSFERIMQLKDRGTTILFCSHSLYQIESICNRAIWLHEGRMKMEGDAADVIAAYSQFLDQGHATAVQVASKNYQTNLSVQAERSPVRDENVDITQFDNPKPSVTSLPRFTRLGVKINGQDVDLTSDSGRRLLLRGAGQSLAVEIFFRTVQLPAVPLFNAEADCFERPTIALTLMTATGLCLASVSTLNQPYALSIDEQGFGQAIVHLDAAPLRRGIFRLDALLGCSKALQLYDQAVGVIVLDIRSEAAEQGLISLSHRWDSFE